MYKRYIILLLAINMSSLYAILGGVGINGVTDRITFPEKIYTSEIEGIYEVTRDAIDSPVGGGGFIYITIIPFIDFEVSGNFTLAPYKYSSKILVIDDVEELELLFGKLTLNISAQYPFFKIPTIRSYLGVGVNQSYYTKIPTVETMTGLNLGKLDDIEYLKEQFGAENFGYHLEFGARFKPPVIPFSLNANARYNFVKDFLPDTESYLTISLGLAFAI